MEKFAATVSIPNFVTRPSGHVPADLPGEALPIWVAAVMHLQRPEEAAVQSRSTTARLFPGTQAVGLYVVEANQVPPRVPGGYLKLGHKTARGHGADSPAGPMPAPGTGAP